MTVSNAAPKTVTHAAVLLENATKVVKHRYARPGMELAARTMSCCIMGTLLSSELLISNLIVGLTHPLTRAKLHLVCCLSISS